MTKPVITPCVGICSTSIAGSICRGCKRYAHEVINWNGYSSEEREIIWNRLESFRCTIIERRIQVEDEQLLKEQLIKQKITFNPALSSAAWVYDLLRAGASQIQDLSEYGLSFLSNQQEQSVSKVFEEIEQEYLALSEAHYARYFSANKN